jgi:hypothetical protein
MVYAFFTAFGPWIGGFLSISTLDRPPTRGA